MNQRFFKFCLSMLAALLISAGAAWTEESAKPAKVDEKANERLKAMSDLLASSKMITFKTDEMHERMRGNQKIEVRVSREVALQRPDRLYFRMSGQAGSDPFDVSVWYDGKGLTLQSDYKKVYAHTKMPPTLDEAIDYAASRLDMPMPMGDMFYSSPYDALMTLHTSGGYVKTETINGASCDLFAFEQKTADWRIWITVGERPLPCQLEITYKLADGQPKSMMTFKDWNLNAQIAEDKFVHQPPSDYEKITIIGRARSDETPSTQSQQNAQ